MAGHGDAAVRDAIAAQIIALPEGLGRSLTWCANGYASNVGDRGADPSSLTY